ncbi:hypothetical protein HZH68_016232 [Vespula germanica]|uniref:Uncharacterized protein n=1 Tax=Vespula germanica TaxID=30212 RepID=A0A834J4E1_VESGE|nr:hypothetical protein HZH68_016232 [Vespula germanica]
MKVRSFAYKKIISRNLYRFHLSEPSEEFSAAGKLENYIHRKDTYFNAMGEIGNVKENPGAIKKDSKKEDLLIQVEEEKEEKADTGDEDVQGECKDYLSTLAHDLMKDRFYLDDIKEKTENIIENRKDYENGRFNHELQNELIKIEIILRGIQTTDSKSRSHPCRFQWTPEGGTL